MNLSAKVDHKTYLRTGIRLCVGVALLVFLFTRHAELDRVWRLIQLADVWGLVFALFLGVCGEIVTAYKWTLLVRLIGGRLSILKAVRASFIGMFYNNFFPGSVGGDIVRVLLIAKDAGGKARAMASAFMQRNTGLAGLFIVGIPAAVIWPRVIDWPENAATGTAPGWLADCRTWLIAAAVGYAAVNTMLFSQAVYRRVWRLKIYENAHKTPPGLHGILRMLFQKIRRFHAEVQGYRFWLPLPLLISAATQMIDVLIVWILAQALGVEAPTTVLMVAVPLVTLANLAPVTVNGIGLREMMYVAVLHSAGVSTNEAVALSLFHFGVIITMAGFGGVLHGVTVGRRAINE